MPVKRPISSISTEAAETLEIASEGLTSLRRSNRSKRAKVVSYAEEEENEIVDRVEKSEEVVSKRVETSSSKRQLESGTAASESTKTNGKRKSKSAKGDVDEIDHETLRRERVSSKWKVGAHVSAAGGVENSIINAAKIGGSSFALFLKSQRKWESPPFKDTNVTLFKERLKLLGYEPGDVLPHGSYLINLGNPESEKREKSYQCFLDDLKRCDQLGLELYNFHPGSTTGLVPASESIRYIAECINRAHKDTEGSRVVVVLENMAGAGNVIGSSFSELGEIIGLVEDKERVGVCLDTCHLFAAGYDIRTKEGWDKTMDSFDSEIGLKYLRGLHLNDSQTGLGSKRDRHENLGLGHLTLQAFYHILRDPRTQGIPMVLETPCYENSKGLEDSWEIWRKEVEVLNRLSRIDGDLSLPGVSGGTDEDKDGEKGEAEAEILETLTADIKAIVDRAKGSVKEKGKTKTGNKVKGRKKKGVVDDDDSEE
ncbi:AP endonuclease [Dendrothele bispora CBS 962.96]|uniref:Apurinic-apyrimidinic endonuclease 1 n=1 Tax=Dendrothele bispora (strain CBS 962.96) TaxID=1314807 RepID=A0A4S8L241_DENBC|nr:AP endonuclease [Dendrothele bispora CBS 962.96]